jgi:hypothetical protein
MPLNKLENFIRSTDGRILYVNPSDINSTDAITNDGTSMSQPFKTIQRSLLEAARFSYVKGNSNDLIEKTTILLFPGEHVVDNRPGYAIYANGDYAYTVPRSGGVGSLASSVLSLGLESSFDLTQEDNILYKFNSIYGGVVVPRGTSIVGLDLRKTKIRPKYVPNPTDSSVSNSAVFRVTGACYFWQFSIFDAEPTDLVYTNPNNFGSNYKSIPNFSHHKLTCFEYADGANKVTLSNGYYTDLTDLDMYYSKVSNAYNAYRNIDQKFPASKDGFSKKTPEWEIVGAFASDPINISTIISGNGASPTNIVTVTTSTPHNLSQGTPIKVKGVSGSGVTYPYNVSTTIQNVLSPTSFTYLLPSLASYPNINPSPSASGATVTVETDTVSGASPYIFNISLRSIWGMNGLHADGSKASGFRSVVVAQFTAVSLQKDDRAFVKYDKLSRTYQGVNYTTVYGSQLPEGSTQTDSTKVYHLDSDAIYRSGWETSHIKVTNDSFAQIVSVFAIGFNKHFDAQSGGDGSITNSNSNFGQISLVSTGFKKEAFSKDNKAFITSIIPPRSVGITENQIQWLSFDDQLTKNAGISSHLYLSGFNAIDILPPSQAQGCRVGAKANDTLYLVSAGSTFSASIYMCDFKIASSGLTTALGTTSGVKEFVVTSGPSSNSFTIGANNLITGEKIRIISDNGDLPENITEHTVYYAINNGDNNTVKLASSYTNAIQLQPIAIYGGTNLRILSRVSDKDSGELGSPIQYDAQNKNWFIHVNADNEIYNTFANNSLPNYSSTKELAFIKRIIDQRSLDEKIYKFRVVIPKEQENARTPESSFVIQESSSTGVRANTDFTRTSIGSTDYEYNKNPRFISTCSVSSETVTVLTELPHNVQSGEIVTIKNVQSSTNSTGIGNSGYNGRFVVSDVTDAFTFKYSSTDIDGNARSPGTFTHNVGIRSTNLPRFERNDFQSNLFIYRNEVIAPYIYNQQDGIYHLYVLNASNAMNTEFTNLEFGQLTANLYPELDRDNATSNPRAAKTFAKRSPLGSVVTNDLKKSITRESADLMLKSLGIGLTISSVSVGINSSTITFPRFHGLCGIVTGSITAGGSYTDGTYYNVKLLNNSQTGSWNGATARVTINSGQVSSVDIISPGSGYSADSLYFDQTRIGAGNGLARYAISASGITANVGDVIQCTGIGTTESSHYRIISIPSSTQISVANTVGDPQIIPSQYAFVVGPSSKVILSYYSNATGITTFTTNAPHGLLVGNAFKVIDSSDNNLGNYFVKERIAYNKFTAITNKELSVSSGYILKHGLSSNEGVSDNTQENFGVRQVSFYNNDTFTLTTAITTEPTISFTTNNSGASPSKRLPLGSYIQIDNEIMRIISSNNTTSATVIRGSLGTRQENHDANSLIRKISPIAVEFRRPSILRASGHTFEYLGYGPGNYSTGLPQVQLKTLNNAESFLSQSQKRSAGVVVYSGMNNSGDVFSGNTKTSASSGEVVSFDIPSPTITGEDPGAANSVLDELTIKNRIFVEGGASGNVLSQFDGPVAFNKTIRAKTIDVSESIRATAYKNFKLTDLPTTNESTFAPDRVLKVKSDASSYELVDNHNLAAYNLRSFGVSNDPTVYVGIGSTVNNQLKISGISTVKFAVNQRVKVFGISSMTDATDVSPVSASATKVGISSIISTFYYWIAQYHMRNGIIGIASQANLTGIGMTSLSGFNDLNNISLTLSRTNTNNGLLIYRQETVGTPAGTLAAANINSAKLVAILGPKELSSGLSEISWIDYGPYEQTDWSPKGTSNEYKDSFQFHFPNVPRVASYRAGWAIDKIVAVGSSSITVENQYKTTPGISTVKVVHDNTYGFTQAINATIESGGNYLDVPSGTYLTNNVTIPSGFTLKGNGKNTIIKKQYFANDLTDGGGNSLAFNGKFVGVGSTNSSDVTIKDITIDGNSGNNILYLEDTDNYLLYFKNTSSGLIKGIEIRNSSGHGLYVYDSRRLSIEDCSFVDGSLTDRYAFQPLNAQQSISLRVNNCLFENYPGPVDLSVTSVVSTSGNIIRNCGTGLRTYASGKITTTNNIILGPSDEYISSPDIYNSDYNSINLTVDRSATFTGPNLLYIENGVPKDISSTKLTSLSAGIGTIISEGTAFETLGTRFLNFNIQTPDTGATYNRKDGYIQLSLTQAQASTLGVTSALGYNIIATEFITNPVGFETYIGIGTGIWYKNGSAFIGAGATQYLITLENDTQFTAISIGDVVKLSGHGSSPDLSSKELTVQSKIDGGILNKKLMLNLPSSLTSITNGSKTGYITIRNTFTIAKGRVGVI